MDKVWEIVQGMKREAESWNGNESEAPKALHVALTQYSEVLEAELEEIAMSRLTSGTPVGDAMARYIAELEANQMTVEMKVWWLLYIDHWSVASVARLLGISRENVHTALDKRPKLNLKGK